MKITKALLAVIATGMIVAPASSVLAKIPPLSEGLARLDKDGDGKVSPAEWAAEKPGLFKKIDANQNGELVREEATAFYLKEAPAEDPKTRRRIDTIMKADANFDGKVTLVELLAAVSAEFKERDVDGDGFITPLDIL